MAAFLVSLNYPCIIAGEVINGLWGRRKPNMLVPRSAVHAGVKHTVSFGPGGFNMAYTGGPLTVIEKLRDV